MPRQFKFILIGMLVLLFMVGVLSLANQSAIDMDRGSIEQSIKLEPTKEKDIKP